MPRRSPGSSPPLPILVAPVGKSQPTVSHHLKVLVEAGLAISERRGRNAWYGLVPAALEACGCRAPENCRSPTVRLTRPESTTSHQHMLTSPATDEMVRALADPLRARIVELLADEQLCTCHLVQLTGARQTNLSNHLRVLRQVGLVEAEPAGRFTYYRLRSAALDEVSARYAELASRAREAATVKRPCG